MFMHVCTRQTAHVCLGRQIDINKEGPLTGVISVGGPDVHTGMGHLYMLALVIIQT